eukprot:4685421-Amphidinium_carterae.1
MLLRSNETLARAIGKLRALGEKLKAEIIKVAGRRNLEVNNTTSTLASATGRVNSRPARNANKD